MLLAGPELIVSIEMMALVEVLGASTFVMMYFAGFKLFLSKMWDKYKSFENYSIFFIPTISVLKQMPSMIIHAVPERTAVALFLGMLTVMMFVINIQNLILA